MLPNIIGFLLVLVALLAIFRYTKEIGKEEEERAKEEKAKEERAKEEKAKEKQKGHNGKQHKIREAFSFPVGEHQDYVEESQKKLNSLTNTINLTDPVLNVHAVNAQEMHDATHGILTKGSAQEYNLVSKAKFEIPEDMPSSLKQAIGCQNAPNTCAAFDDGVFAKNCGMSFDREGMGSNGKPHVGGLYVAPDDRELQTARARKVRETGIPPYDPYHVYQPSLGIAKPGTFSLTKDQCIVVKEKVDCEAKQSFNSPNCTQCFTSQRFSRVGADTPRIPSTLFFAGQGKLRIESQDPELRMAEARLEPDKPLSKVLPAEAEGKNFVIVVDADERMPTYLSGYLNGQTGRGEYKIDLNTLIQSDLVTQARPKMMGTKRVNGFRALSFVPGSKQKSMRLACMMPFSFLSTYEPDTIYCDNGPLVTKESSATFLESDPCYGKANSVGNYKLDCLQSRWIALGGTTEGTGFPSDQQKANAIQRDLSGRGRSIDDIMDTLSEKMEQAITGRGPGGNQLDVSEWNEISMWGLGVPIKSPCDGIQKDAGPLSKECLAYLYQNRGAESHVGSTFTMPAGTVASTKGMRTEGWQDAPNTFAYPNAPLDPKAQSGLTTGQSLGGVESVKQQYDAVHRKANDNTQMNTNRANEIKLAYGMDLPSSSSSSSSGFHS